MPFMGTGAVGDNLVVVPAVIGFKDHQFKPPKQLNVNTFKDSPPPFGGKRSQESLKNQKARKRNAKDNSASPLVSPLHSKSFAWKLAAAIGTTDDDDGFDFKTEHKTASLQDAAAEPVHTVDDVPDIQQPSLDGKDDHMSEKDQLVPRLETGVAGDSQPRVEDPGGDPVNGMILERQGSILKQNEELQFEVNMHVPEVVQVDSYSKANQELNDLQMKANELEKLFEQHKRRVLGDHSTSKKLPSDSNSGKELDANSITSMVVDHEDYGRFSNSGASKLKMEVDFPESKGKFYDRYVEKRDAKLREELAQKEAKMKAMEESLERNRAEMEAKFSGYSSRNQDSNLNARCRAERLRSFNIRSTDENNEQVSFIDSVDDEFPENNLWELRRSLPWESTDVSSSNSAAKKVVSSNRTSSSSIPRTSTIPITKSSTKPSHSPLNKRRTMLENSKASPTHRQRKYNRSRSNIDEFSISKEFKPREAQSLRNSSARESKDASSVIAERVDQTNKASKPFLKKGSGVGPGAGANVAKLKALTASENLKSEKELDESPQKMQEDPVAVLVKVEEEAEAHSDPLIEEQGFMAANAAVISENENLMLKWESEKSSHSGFRNSEVLELFSQVDPNAVAEAAALPSTLHGIIEPMQDFIEESTGSRNPLVQPTFSSSDDACLESPIGSHSSWNSQSLTKLESEVMMRNKSGRTIVPANTSHHHYRKDVKKGIKRLLKFGKKSKKKESIVGWVSPATTSDADYDNVESRDDNSNRPSDELQKSRLGYPESRTSYDSFSNSEVYSEQAKRSSNPAASEMFKPREDRISGGSSKAPRSFFSLSSFRTKGSESKSRLKESYNSY